MAFFDTVDRPPAVAGSDLRGRPVRDASQDGASELGRRPRTKGAQAAGAAIRVGDDNRRSEHIVPRADAASRTCRYAESRRRLHSCPTTMLAPAAPPPSAARRRPMPAAKTRPKPRRVRAYNRCCVRALKRCSSREHPPGSAAAARAAAITASREDRPDAVAYWENDGLASGGGVRSLSAAGWTPPAGTGKPGAICEHALAVAPGAAWAPRRRWGWGGAPGSIGRRVGGDGPPAADVPQRGRPRHSGVDRP